MRKQDGIHENNCCSAADLRCEGQVFPIGITDANPGFSWLFVQDGHDRMQSAYRIIVSDQESAIISDSGGMWDSGKTMSSRTYRIPYQGRPLSGRKKYYWKVCTWDAQGNCGGFSQASAFETGLMKKSDWKAEWIGGADLLRKEFAVRPGLEKAKLFATGLGYSEFYFNGKKVSDRVLSPSFTEYKKRIEYIVVDVTDLLQSGPNAAGIMLGNGWFRHGGRNSMGGMSGCSWYHDKKMALAHLDLTYSDGTRETVMTDKSWKGSEGPVIEDSVFDGEQYDARMEKDGWATPEYQDKSWQPAEWITGVDAELVPAKIPPIRAIEDITPVEVRHVAPGIWIVDFGVNIAGWVRLRAKGERSTKITMEFAELLGPDGRLNMKTLEKSSGKNTYIMKGVGTEIYEPRFTYYGFRYMEVQGYPGKPDKSSFTARTVHSAVRETGSFTCSLPIFNQIHDIMKRTLSNNLHGIPTDCCQRNERLGWMADGFIASEACIYNFGMHEFYKKWLDDIRDTQNELTGEIMSCQAPSLTNKGYITWNMAYPYMVWSLFRHYGDKDTVRKHYLSLKKYLAFLQTYEDKNGMIRPMFDEKAVHDGYDCFGDWLSIQYTAAGQIDNAMYFLMIKIMAELAAAIGNENDHLQYSHKAEMVKSQYNECYLEPVVKDSGYYNALDRISQAGNALPLFFDMVPDHRKADVAEKLLWQIGRARGTPQLTTGIIGTKFLMELLAQLGENKLVAKLLSRTEYPGWGFMVRQGATTVWERWEDMEGMEMNSHDHPALASADPLFWKSVAGIWWPQDEGGIRVFKLHPAVSPELDFAEGCLETPWGKASLRWERNGGELNIHISLPANTRGHLQIDQPDGMPRQEMLLGSGQYNFTLKQ